MRNLAETEFLIIAGQPKAGSTSMFDWLAAHPEFCPARIKEARFFLAADYPIPSGTRYDGHNLDSYLSLFPDNGGRILLDASPDYMFCPGFAKVAELLPRAKVILLQRDPVERLVSWYRYAAQRGFLHSRTGFADFLALQETLFVDAGTPVWQRALDQNRFDHYAAPILDAFGDRAKVVRFDALRDTPRALLSEICDFVGADEAGFAGLDLEARNVTSGEASGTLARYYYKIRAMAAYNLPLSPEQMARLRPLSQALRKCLSGSRHPVERPDVDDKTRQFILKAARL